MNSGSEDDFVGYKIGTEKPSSMVNFTKSYKYMGLNPVCWNYSRISLIIAMLQSFLA